MTTERIIIVGGPRAGKSSMARAFRAQGIPTYCGDPRSKVKDVEPDVTYLPENIPMSGDDGAAQWVVDNWMTRPGPWLIEGWITARALRRWDRAWNPCDRILVMRAPVVEQTPGQAALTKAVATVWRQIALRFRDITEYL